MPHQIAAPEVSPARSSEDTQFRLSILDEHFESRSFRTTDPQITGAQIAELARKHPVENFVVMRHLPSGELESLRPAESSPLQAHAVSDFFVIEGAETFRFTVSGLSMEWPLRKISGSAIKRLARKHEEDVVLILEREDVADEVIEDEQEVQIGARGLERFKIRPAPKLITIYVDGEPFEIEDRRLTPNEIIRRFAEKDPATNYLLQIGSGDPVSYQGKGDEIIKLRNKMRFQVISVGPTPVSDSGQTGVALFSAGLRRLGYSPRSLPNRADHLIFGYVVESGRFKGTAVQIGLIVPVDFPVNPPTGPYVSPEIHPINTDGEHPRGRVHKQQALVFDTEAGGSWQYWSRPYPGWNSGRDPVAKYLSHIWKLWDSQ